MDRTNINNNFTYLFDLAKANSAATDATTLVYGDAQLLRNVTLSNSATAYWYVAPGTSNVQINVPEATNALAIAQAAQVASSNNTTAIATKVTATNAYTPVFIQQDGGRTVSLYRATGNYFSCARTNDITVTFADTNQWAVGERMTSALDLLAGTGAVTFLPATVWNIGTASSTNLGTLTTTATIPLIFDKASGNLFPARIYNLAK